MTFAFKYELVSAVGGGSDGLSEVTPKFEVEIKGALEVTIELHLKMHMVVHFLLQKSARNNSIKDKLEEALSVVHECAPKISL